MAQSVTYTGENSAVKLPDLDKLIRSQERVGEMTIAGREKLLQRKREDSNFVLEQMKANPVLLISDRLRTQQADAIKKYKEYGAKLSQQNDGVLSYDAKLALQREKEALTMMQQTMQADQQRFVQEFALMQKDQGSYYDEKEFKAAMDSFYETGQYPPTALIAKPQSFLNALSTDRAVFSQPKEKRTRVVDGVEWQYDVTTRMTPEEAKIYIADKAMGNEAYLRDIVNQFEKQPEAEQAKYLDMDADGKVSPDERQQVKSAMDVNNPIIKWAQDYYMPYALKETELTGTRTPVSVKGGTTKPFNVNIAVGSGNNRNNTYTLIEEPRTEGQYTFPSFVDIKKSTTGRISLNGARRARDGKEMPPMSIDIDVVGYSPQTDEILVAAKQDDVAKGVRKGETYVLDGETYRGLVENKDIGLHRASYKGFKQGGGQPSFQGSYVEYKKKYPNGTPEEYRTLTGNR